MTSIRIKLTLGAAALFAAAVGILIASNALFMEPYYAARTKAAFEGIEARMAASRGDGASELSLAKAIASGTGYKIVVADGEGMVRASSVPEFQEGQTFPLPREQLEFFLERRARLAGGASFFGILDASPSGQSVIQLMAGMGEGRFLVITQPLEELRRNIAAASPFFLAVGSLVLGLVFAIALAFAGRIARPILELSEVARRIAAADYGARYSHSRRDELGALGDSINAMAGALSRSIEELTAANLGLAEKVKAQEDFIAGASHELKTPVGLVRGYAEAIRLGLYSTESERDELADVILKEADHLDRLVRDLAQIAASGGAGRSIALAEGDLFEALSNAVARFALAAKDRRVSIGLEGRGPLPARFDPDRLVQIMDNLLSNALRHAPEGGVIAVRAAAEADSIRVEVENSGEPIPERHLTKLFEPFYRADSSRTRRSGGSGLGLALVKSLVAAHGGSCGVRNTPTGALFWFVLPGGARRAQPPAARP
jgi:two-component system, OmpR family, sensor histidine kinase VanS